MPLYCRYNSRVNPYCFIILERYPLKLSLQYRSATKLITIPLRSCTICQYSAAHRGGPGVGKTTVLSQITELCAEYNLPLLCAAMTGIIIFFTLFMPYLIHSTMAGVAAGTLMNGMTLHSCFDLKVIEDKYSSSGSFQEALTPERVYYLRQVIFTM